MTKPSAQQLADAAEEDSDDGEEEEVCYHEMDKPNKFDNKLFVRNQVGGWVPEQEVADTQEEQDPNEISRRNYETSLQNQEHTRRQTL